MTKEIEFDVELTVKELYAFSMHHTYVGISGIFGLIISLGSWLVCILRFASLDTTARMALIIIGCLFTIVQPVMLYSKARAQIRRNKNINAALHYRLSEDGITVSQGEQEASVKWHEIRKKVTVSKAVYIYMSPVRAFIFPEKQCGEKYPEICRMITRQMEVHREDGAVEEDGTAGQPDAEGTDGKDL